MLSIGSVIFVMMYLGGKALNNTKLLLCQHLMGRIRRKQMAIIRLNHEKRSRILSQYLADVLGPLAAEESEAQGAFAEKIYEIAYPAEIRAFMDKLPLHLINTSQYISLVRLPTSARIPSQTIYFSNKQTRRMTRVSLSYLDLGLDLATLNDLAAPWYKIYREYFPKRDQIRRVTKRIIDSVATVNQLVEIFPEIEASIPKNLGQPCSDIPVSDIALAASQQIKKLLGKK